MASVIALKPNSWLTDAYALQGHSDFRQQHFAKFMQRGLPTRREEAWKYADLTFLTNNYTYSISPLAMSMQNMDQLLLTRATDHHLLVLINGHYSLEHSVLGDLPAGVIMGSLRSALQSHTQLVSTYLSREIDAKKYPFACLNAAFLADGLFVYIPSNTRLTKPIYVLSVATGNENFMSHPCHLVVLESGAAATFIDETVAVNADYYFTNTTQDFFVGSNANLDYYKIQNEADNAKHIATISILQQAYSTVHACSFSFGAQFARNDIHIDLLEQHAVCNVNGYYRLRADTQYADHHIYVNHVAPHTESNMDFRGVLAKQSRAVFAGKVIVQPAAKKTKAQQFNRNLLLTPQAEVDTKPELEIYADDVQCRHGATIGQLDEETLFYLATRGIDRDTATTMLLQAFMDSALAYVKDLNLKNYLAAEFPPSSTP